MRQRLPSFGHPWVACKRKTLGSWAALAIAQETVKVAPFPGQSPAPVRFQIFGELRRSEAR